MLLARNGRCSPEPCIGTCGCSLYLFDASLTDHLGPARNIPLNLRRELFWSVADRGVSNRRKALPYIGQHNDTGYLTIELLDDFLWCASRHKHRLNELRLLVRHTGLCQSWDARKSRIPLATFYGKRAQLALLDARCCPRQGAPHNRRVATYRGRDRWRRTIERHVREIKAERYPKQLSGKLPGCARARRGIAVFAWISLHK